MTTLEFLSQLRKSGIELQVAGDHLRINAPEGVLTPALKAELIARKEEILKFLKTTRSENQSTTNIPLYPRDGYLPLSYSQERLWFLDQLEPGNPAYNMHAAIRLKGRLNLTWLEQALNEIITRHEVLRTNFDVVQDQPAQIIAPPKPFRLNVIDLSNLPAEAQTAEARRLTEEEARCPFDLRRDLLIRASLLKLNAEEHVFLLTMHHIVSDGWSITVFSRELTSLYHAFANGQSNPLSPLPIQYADYACWQREWLQGERLERQLAHWKHQLEGELPQLETLLDKPRPPVKSHQSGRVNLELSAALSQALRQLSQQEDATLFMVLLAAFKLLLHRQSGLEDIIVGSPIAGRTRAETENLIGFFLNTLVLRTDLSGNPSFRELIQRVKQVATDAFSHQDIPFEKLLIELQPERDLSRTPLFQIFFNMLNLEGGEQQLPGLTAETFETPDIGSKFDLTVYVTERNKTTHLTIVYDSELFTAERITELLSQYNHLLSQIVEDPNEKANVYSLVTPSQMLKLPDPVLPLDTSWHGAVHSKFSKNAKKLSRKIALVDRDAHWTYQELDQGTNQLSHFLLRQGLNAQRVVAVYGHRSAALVWAVLGILKAGGAFLILDPAYPSARLLDYLDIAKPQAFIQLEAAGDPPPELESWAKEAVAGRRISLPKASPSHYKGILDDYPVHDPDVSVGPDHIACISFTSGSTGKPKGVMGRHGSLSHFLPWQSQKLQLSESDHFSMLSGLSHDPLQRDIFTALWVGASIHIPDPDQIGTPGWLNHWMKQENITFCHFTPAMAQLLTTSSSAQQNSDGQLPSLRFAFFVGDKLTRHDVHQLGQLAPNVVCINSYGSTETQRAVGYLLVDPRDTSQIGSDGVLGKAVIPVGKGMEDVQLLVLTGNQQLAGIGELGEIYVRSPHLAKGYLGDESLTRERFIINPFTNTPGDLLYKSGDLGRFLPDGKVEFLGRRDTQVKIRGFRIELGEIENILNEHPAVQQTVLDVWSLSDDDKRLVAYVVPKEEGYRKTAELQEYLRERLPAHMIPANITFLETIPVTPNGKINRSALPRPSDDERSLEREQVEARNDIEKELVRIWQELLHVRKIGVKDNFFELGGHSLMAVRMFTRIAEKFNVNLPLSTLFQESTIEHLARAIHSQASPVTWSSLIEIEPAGDQPPFFCVHGITGDILWFRDLAKALAPNYPFYGLQARGLDGVQQPFSRIESMAQCYIAEIRLLQPHGPYYLGGASFGGTVALEIAQQLLSEGEEVALLAIFDHAPPNTKLEFRGGMLKKRLEFTFKVIRNFPYWLKGFIELGPSRMLMRIRRKMRLAQKARGRLTIGHLEDLDATDIIDFAPELPAYRQQLIKSHYHAMKVYVPQPYPGQVTLFRAKSRPLLNTFDPEVSWQKLCPGRIRVIDISSSHEGMFRKPHVYQLAQALKSCIDSVCDHEADLQTDEIQSKLSANLLHFLFPLILMSLLS